MAKKRKKTIRKRKKTIRRKVSRRIVRKKTKKTKKVAPRRRATQTKKVIKKAKTETFKKIKVRLIGIGSGGGSIVSEISQRVKGASFFAANTDLKALKGLPGKVNKFHFGQDLTHGLGTGMNPELGEVAAKNEKKRIKKILEGQDFVILIASLGGGTGSGAAPVFANISKNLGNLTYGIFTLPFKFEGGKKMEIAKNSLKELSSKLNALSIIPNERIFQVVDKTVPLKNALSEINKSLSNSLQNLIEIVYRPGLINIDFADLRTVFEGRGRLAYLNTVEIGKEEDGAIKKVINSPLYPYSIDGAKGVLFNISGKEDLSLAQINQISKAISDKVYKEARIIFGISRAKKSSRIKVSLLATGCDSKGFFGASKDKTKKKVKKVDKKNERTKKRKIVRVAKHSLRKKLKRQREIVKPKIRKTGLQVKKDIENEEAEIISKEKFWETPSFLRRKR